MSELSAEAVKVAYICDGRKCDNDCSECFRTLDIEHARDFKLMGDTYYQKASAEAENETCDTCKYYETSHEEFPCSDCTFGNSRYVSSETVHKPDYSYEADMVKRLRQAEAVQGWIPCSKRLPENTAEWKAYLTCNEQGLISTTYWADGWNCWRNSDGEISRACELTDIVAWMPLPTPYKERNE